MKVKCTYCGRPNGENNDLCLSCGAPLPILVETKEIQNDFNWNYPSLNASGSFHSMGQWTAQLIEAQNG